MLKIVFMGTPEFAVPSLSILLENNYSVVGVVTAPDKPAGRGKKLQASAVKVFAQAKGIPVLQPEKLKDEAFLAELKSLEADLQIVVAFRMLPEVVWAMPPLGTFNLHASLLPQYRGAAPINWAIIQGETQTGLSTFFLQQEIDTGNIILQASEPIGENDTAGDLHDRLMQKGAELVLETVRQIEQGGFQTLAQDLSKPATPAPKIFKEDCQIDWQKPVASVHNFVRGLSPVPTAFTNLQDKYCKIYKTNKHFPDSWLSQFSTEQQAGAPWLTDNKHFLLMRCSDGFLSVEELQVEGGKRLPIKAFLAGNKL